MAKDDVYICPAGEKLTYRHTTEEGGLVVSRYWVNVCQSCAIKNQSTSDKERRITRWEREHILEAVQKRLGRIKARMGATHFLMKTLLRVASTMALHVLAYNLTRVMNIMGVQPILAAMKV